jgi:hypothetical protein
MRHPTYTNEYNLIVRGDTEICSFSAADKATINERYKLMRDYVAVKGREVIVRAKNHRIAALACWSTLLWLDDVPSPQEVFKRGFEALDKPLKDLYSYLISTKSDLAYACEQVDVPVADRGVRMRLLTDGGIFQCDQCKFWCSTNELEVDNSEGVEYICSNCHHWRGKGYK